MVVCLSSPLKQFPVTVLVIVSTSLLVVSAGP